MVNIIIIHFAKKAAYWMDVDLFWLSCNLALQLDHQDFISFFLICLASIRQKAFSGALRIPLDCCIVVPFSLAKHCPPYQWEASGCSDLARLVVQNLIGLLECVLSNLFPSPPPTTFLGLFTRWICHINPRDSGKLPSGVLSRLSFSVRWWRLSVTSSLCALCLFWGFFPPKICFIIIQRGLHLLP